ncbi:MAG: ABC transporter ATP-binding protein [Chitinivibrionales bacterium]
MAGKSISGKPIIEVRNLVAKYGDTTVLDDVSLDVEESEIKVILGTSGCGKTTLLKNILGLIRPYSGSVKIFDREVGELDSEVTSDILKQTGVLFQNGALLGSMTVGENVALPLKMHTSLPEKVIDEIVQLKLSQVGLPDTAELHPGELSGGMKKRAAMARALALDPPLLFCDEPSAGLDPVTAKGLDELLLRIREMLGITIFAITHELLSIKYISDNIIFLNKGRILYDGSLEDALKEKEGPVFNFFNRSK